MNASENNLNSELSQIENNLWLGSMSAATNVPLLLRKNIKSVLTISSHPVPFNIYSNTQIKNKYIQVNDCPREDLLSFFEDTFNFIEKSMEHPGASVLVHCEQGVSRSATVVASYLMKKKQMTVAQALSYIKAKRKSIGPNPGFLEQLKLYETMGWKLEKSNTQYRMFRLYIAVDLVVKNSGVPEQCRDVVKFDPCSIPNDTHQSVYRCKKCRRILATGSNIIPHGPKEKYSWRNERWSGGEEVEGPVCREVYMIEPLAWMEGVTTSLEGKLICPNPRCAGKLGFFSWSPGCKCPCGTQVCPGFYLVPAKVDFLKVK